MRFSFRHEIDATLEAVERALLEPGLGEALARNLRTIERIDTLEHVFREGVLHRVLRFQASAPLPIFAGRPVARDAMAWQEHVTYTVADHASRWRVTTTRPEWDRYYDSAGTYRLERAAGGRTLRIVEGDLNIHVKLVGAMAERVAVAEVKKSYAAEAEALRELASR